MRTSFGRATPSIVRRFSWEERAVAQHIREGRFQRSLCVVTALAAALSGLEVTYEHYRGSYSRRVMYSPVILSALLFITALVAAVSRRCARSVLPLLSAFTLIDGFVGFFCHVRGIARKPGGWRFPAVNLAMGPPVLAPVLFGLAGYLGIVASLLKREDDPDVSTGLVSRFPAAGSRSNPLWSILPRAIRRDGLDLDHRVREGRFQKNIALVAGLSALFSGFESLYSHYEDDFRYPRIQWSPIVISVGLGAAGIGTVWSRRLARTALPLASVIALVDGLAGFFFHARGIVRKPGGLKLPLYNTIYGPPILAPLLFAASGSMGVLAALLRRAD